MKVLMIGPFPPVLNGVTVSNEFLFSNLEKKGWTVNKINTETGKIASLQGDKISLYKIITFLSIYKSLFKIFRNNIIYITSGQTFWGLVKYTPFIVLGRLLKIPYVLHIHGGYICKSYQEMRPYKRFIFRQLINRSASVITLSKTLADEFKTTFSKTSVQIVENFYDPNLIPVTNKKVEHGKPRFIFLSNLMLGKGILDFLDALMILKYEKGIDFELAIAGNVEKGIGGILEEKMNLLKDSVHFFGVANFEKKKELLHWSEIFVLPTWYIMEGQPISIIEAYVTGNIVVSTNQGGIKDIGSYNTFFQTPIKNPGALAGILEKVIKDRSVLQEECEQTMLLTQKRFNADNFLMKVEAIFLDVKSKN